MNESNNLVASWISNKADENTLKEVELTSGVIILQSNTDKDPKEIFELYKKRWTIETYYDFMKNDIDFEALGIQDYQKIIGMNFIVMISNYLWRLLMDRIKNYNDTEKKEISFADVILESSFLIMTKNLNENWNITNATNGSVKMLEKLGLNTKI
jgi:hypothetical protein